MKNTLRATAVAAALASTAGTALAQSSVTVYGRVDQTLAQQADAVKNREMRPGSGNRLGFRGVEDLGGGLKAVFQIEHRFNADEGTLNNASVFWHGKSIVGLDTSVGRFTLGREENAAFLLSQSIADPFGTDTVAANNTIFQGRIGAQRYANSLNYWLAAGPITFGAQIAELDGNTPSTSVPSGAATLPAGRLLAEDRPYSLGLNYKAGGLQLSVGYENPADKDDDWLTVTGGYNFGSFRVGALVGSGKNYAAQKHQAVLVSGAAQLGSGEFRVSYGTLKNKDAAANGTYDKQLGLGYHHALSKRTTLYTDFVNEKRDNIPGNFEKNGWDFGIKHNF